MNNVTEKAHEDKTVFAGFSNPWVSGVLEGKDSDSGRIERGGMAAQFQRMEHSRSGE